MSIGTFLQIQSDVYSSLLLQCVFAGNKDKYVSGEDVRKENKHPIQISAPTWSTAPISCFMR